VTVPPDFGGRALEEDLPEDLGAPHEEHSVAHEDQDEGEWSDNELRDGRWMHEICPVT